MVTTMPTGTARVGGHVVVLLGSDEPAALRLYGAWCLDCRVKTGLAYITPDVALKALTRRAGHAYNSGREG